MQTQTDRTPTLNLLDPFGSWDAVARWNAMASEWMASGWRQWMELLTVWPALEPVNAGPHPVVPAQAGTQEARDARTLRAQAAAAEGRSTATRVQREARPTARATATAKATPKRPSTRRPARPQAGGRSPRARG
jgi:hypothetical protein